MRMWRIVVPAVVLASVWGCESKLPTAEEVLQKATAAWGAVKTFQADQKLVGEAPKMTETGTIHVAMEKSEKDGKAVEKVSVSAKYVRRAADGKEEVEEGRVVNDGTFFWQEKRSPAAGGLQVTKTDAEGRRDFKFSEKFLRSMTGDWKAFHYKAVSEDTLDGQKMYVLEGAQDAAKLDKTIIKESKKKLGVGQGDFLIHREVHTVQVPDHDKPIVSTMEFANIKVNQPVDPALFVYTPPEGVKIDDRTKAKP